MLRCVGVDALGWELGAENRDQGTGYGSAEGCADSFGAGEGHPVACWQGLSVSVLRAGGRAGTTKRAYVRLTYLELRWSLQ